MSFKPGDRVVDLESNGDVGVVLREHETHSDTWWVLWETGLERGQELYINVASMALAVDGVESRAESRLKALQPLLDEVERRAEKMGTESGFTVFIDEDLWEQIKDAV